MQKSWATHRFFERCGLCNKNEVESGNSLKACGGCNVSRGGQGTLYCSRHCQKTDWPRHKAHCQSMAEMAKYLALKKPDRVKARMMSRWQNENIMPLHWAIRQAFQTDPNLNNEETYLYLELVEVKGSKEGDEIFLEPNSIQLLSKKDAWHRLTGSKPGRQRVPDFLVTDFVVLIAFDGAAEFYQVLKDGSPVKGVLGEVPSLPQWPWLIFIASHLRQMTNGDTSSWLAWEYVVNGWVRLSERRNLDAFNAPSSMYTGWEVTDTLRNEIAGIMKEVYSDEELYFRWKAIIEADEIPATDCIADGESEEITPEETLVSPAAG